jgi:predicted MFS family arabinose efflux permease
LKLILTRLILPTVLLHIAFSGCRVNLSLTALSLGASPFIVGAIASMLAVLPMFFAVSAGRMIDRIGPRTPMLLGAAMELSGLVLGYAVPQLEMLFLVSALAGSGFMLFHIAVNHATGAMGTPDDRMKNFSLLALGFSTANFLGPTASGFAIDLVGHRNTFLMLSASAGAAVLVIIAQRLPFTPPPPHNAAAGKQRIADLFRIPTLRHVLLVSAILSMAWDMFTFLVPIYGSQIGLSASQIGLILGAFGAAIFTVRVALPLVARRIGQWQMLTIAMLATGCMLFVFPLFSTLPVLMGIAFLLGIGLGGAQPMIMSLVVTHAPAGRGGEAVGVRTLLLNCSQAGIPLVFGALGAAFGMAPVFWVMALALTGGGYLSRKPGPALSGRQA